MDPLKEFEKLKNKPIEKNMSLNAFTSVLNKLTEHHYKKSKEYKKILDGLNYNPKIFKSIENLPFLPARLFKFFDMLSIKKSEIFKTLSSSGTSGMETSKVYLDKLNASNQIKVLEKIIKSKIGNQRLPMMVVGKDNNFLNKNNFNAQRAAINGFSLFAKKIVYLLDQNNNIDFKKLKNFLQENSNYKFIIFGFTSNIFTQLVEKLPKKSIEKKFLTNAIIIHGGGWKNLEYKKINNLKFKNLLSEKLGIKKDNIINYYGLVEQTGSIFFECKCGFFITSDYSSILIRDKKLNILKEGERGFIQLISMLPSSYPGHSILTEDIGEIVSSKVCKCENKENIRFLVHGRVPKAELRGCSNFL